MSSRKLHGQLFNELELFREKHPDFYYGTRKKDTKGKLSQGLLFREGATYVSVSLSNMDCNKHFTSCVYLSFSNNEQNPQTIDSHFVVVYDDENRTNATAITIFDKIWKSVYSSTDIVTKYSAVGNKCVCIKPIKIGGTIVDALSFLDTNYKNIYDELKNNNLAIDQATFNKFINTFLKLSLIHENGKVSGYYIINTNDSIIDNIGNNHDDNNILCNFPLNLILFGPPGTGKTYNTIYKTLDILGVKNPNGKMWFGDDKADRKKALVEFDKLKANHRIVFTTFHQSMSYEDFIEGIKPETDNGGNVTYEVKDGIFKEICKEAESDLDNNYVLIIDEINRGNVANIFGELITLIEEDKRLENTEGLKATLPYSIDKETEKHEEFGVPKNLYIIGTMNTADRSVEALDSALRRRFSFIEMMPKPELLNDKNVSGINLKSLLETINKRIEVLKDREHQIGHSYFMEVETEEELKNVMFDKVIPLLQEYFYGDYAKIRMVLGDGFVNRKDCKLEFASDDEFDKPSYIYSIADKNSIDMSKALEVMKI